MDFTKFFTLANVLATIGTSLSLTGLILWFIVLKFRLYNFRGEEFFLIPPKVYLILFLGSISFLLSDYYQSKWSSFIIQFLVSCLYFCIYIIHRKTYKAKLEDENR